MEEYRGKAAFPAVRCPQPGPVACAHARGGPGLRGCPAGSPWGTATVRAPGDACLAWVRPPLTCAPGRGGARSRLVARRSPPGIC